MSTIKIITTSDGSHSLLDTSLNETYHSIHGAIQESQHVFIRAGLDHWLQKNKKNEIRIFEAGFGTGLNVFLTALHHAFHEVRTYYESWEAFPLETNIIKKLNYPVTLGSPEIFSRIHEVPWNQPTSILTSFTLSKKRGDILVDPIQSSPPFDLIYYDAFAPLKQPEMWTLSALKKISGLLAPSGVLVTYCAKGQVKRDLKLLGLSIEAIPGPPGKKEMIRGTREGYS